MTADKTYTSVEQALVAAFKEIGVFVPVEDVRRAAAHLSRVAPPKPVGDGRLPLADVIASPLHVALWEEINRLADSTPMTIGHMSAVVRVETAIGQLLAAVALPKPVPVGVTITEEMVEEAMRTFYSSEHWRSSHFSGQLEQFADQTRLDMRAALTAALSPTPKA